MPPTSKATAVALAAPEAPLARRNVGEVVADHIRQLVFDGRLRDGERVPQRGIAQTLGVSSIPVREALVALEREGVVSIHAGRGAFVNGLDPDVALEQFYVFGRIYGLAARRAAERADAAWLEQLCDLAERIERGGDLAATLAASIRFQLLIVDKGGSKRLLALFRPLSQIVPGNFYASIPGSLQRTRQGVVEIVAACQANDPERAESACWAMMDDIGALVAGELNRRSADRSAGRGAPGPAEGGTV
jgi:DNA-binding GntR family transcriptional regulator